MNKINEVWRWGAIVALSLTAAALPAQPQEKQDPGTQDTTPRERRLGWVMPANQFIGHKVDNQQGQNLGLIRNLIADFESGRILYVVVDPGTAGGQDLVGVPATLFRFRRETNAGAAGPEFVLRSTAQQLKSAPRFTSQQRQDLADVNFATQVYQHFGVPAWWGQAGGKFGNVHRASDVPGMAVRNVSNESLGKLDQLLVDLPAGHIAYAAFDPAGGIVAQGEVVPLPPMGFTLGQDQKSMVLDATKEKLQSAPRVRMDQLRRLSDWQFASNVYRYWGKQPWFVEGMLTPTGPSRSTNQ